VKSYATSPLDGGDPAAIGRYLTQATDIRTALGAGLTVSYQGQDITPAGSEIDTSLVAPNSAQGGA